MLRTTIEVTVDVEIARSRGAVWAFLTDAERLPDWLEEFRAVRGTVGPGATLHYTVEPGGRSGSFQIVEWVPPERFAWDGPPLRYRFGGARPRGAVELSDAGPGRTRVVGRFRPELTGAAVLMRPAWARWLRRQRPRDAERLKALLERG